MSTREPCVRPAFGFGVRRASPRPLARPRTRGLPERLQRLPEAPKPRNPETLGALQAAGRGSRTRPTCGRRAPFRLPPMSGARPAQSDNNGLDGHLLRPLGQSCGRAGRLAALASAHANLGRASRKAPAIFRQPAHLSAGQIGRLIATREQPAGAAAAATFPPFVTRNARSLARARQAGGGELAARPSANWARGRPRAALEWIELHCCRSRASEKWPPPG